MIMPRKCGKCGEKVAVVIAKEPEIGDVIHESILWNCPKCSTENAIYFVEGKGQNSFVKTPTIKTGKAHAAGQPQTGDKSIKSQLKKV
jgi:hypothetical protein